MHGVATRFKPREASERAVSDLAPYATQRELLEDELAAVHDRLRAAKAQLAARASNSATQAWPASMLDHEAEIAARLLSSNVDALPIDHLRVHFELSATEVLVLWVLIAHELCPIARSLIRDLNSEHLADPTTDTLRRAVYGAEVGARDAWHELSDDGAL